MAVHKTIDQAKKNLEDSLGTIGARHQAGVQAANWQGPASSDNAESLYASEMAKAIAAKKRQKAIQAMTNTDWQTATISKGSSVIAERLRSALGKYASRMGPVLTAMNTAADSLRPRVADYKANIANRLYPVIDAAKKAAGKG